MKPVSTWTFDCQDSDHEDHDILNTPASRLGRVADITQAVAGTK